MINLLLLLYNTAIAIQKTTQQQQRQRKFVCVVFCFHSTSFSRHSNMRKSLLFVYRDTLPLPLRRNPDTRATTNANDPPPTAREDSQQANSQQPQLSKQLVEEDVPRFGRNNTQQQSVTGNIIYNTQQ